MNRLTHWNPFRGMSKADFPGGFEDFFREFSLRPNWRGTDELPEIRIDVSEDEKSYAIKADIPGVSKDDIEVTVEGRQVTICADTKRETERKEGEALYSERSSGRVWRAFMLPAEAESADATAHYEGGVLHLTLPKKHVVEQRRILVS